MILETKSKKLRQLIDDMNETQTMYAEKLSERDGRRLVLSVITRVLSKEQNVSVPSLHRMRESEGTEVKETRELLFFIANCLMPGDGVREALEQFEGLDAGNVPDMIMAVQKRIEGHRVLPSRRIHAVNEALRELIKPELAAKHVRVIEVEKAPDPMEKDAYKHTPLTPRVYLQEQAAKKAAPAEDVTDKDLGELLKGELSSFSREAIEALIKKDIRTPKRLAAHIRIGVGQGCDVTPEGVWKCLKDGGNQFYEIGISKISGVEAPRRLAQRIGYRVSLPALVPGGSA